jgi:hypothetical protein
MAAGWRGAATWHYAVKGMCGSGCGYSGSGSGSGWVAVAVAVAG